MLSDVRIPISLKVAQDDFYYDFVLPKKDTKELSSFIHDLMKVYYETEEVRLVVDKYLVSADKITVIRRDLDAIIKEQLANQMETDALVERFETEKEKIVTGMYDVPETYHATKENERQAQLLIGSSENSSEQNDSKTPGASAANNLEERTKKLEEKFDGFDAKLSQLFNILTQGGGIQTPTPAPVTAEVKDTNTVNVASVEKSEKVVAEPSFVPEVPQVNNSKEEDVGISIPPVSNSDVSHDITAGQPVIMSGPTIEDGPDSSNDDASVSKPAAFSKMMRSMK